MCETLVTGLHPATAYTVRLAAYNTIDQSTYSEPVVVKTKEEGNFFWICELINGAILGYCDRTFCKRIYFFSTYGGSYERHDANWWARRIARNVEGMI